MNILRIDSSVRKEGSYSRTLSDKLIKRLCEKQQTVGREANIFVRDLSDGIPLIDDDWSKANFTGANDRTQEQHKHLAMSDLLVEELFKADALVIGLPIYNFNVPAAFKAWIDQVVRSKLTFKYTESGPVGLVNNKKAYIIVVSGGTQLGTNLDFISGYLRHIFSFIGITDITFIDGSGLGKNETASISRVEQIIEKT